MKKENHNLCCCIFTIIASLLAAAGIAAVFFSGLVGSIVTLVILTLILGILGLLFIIFTVFCGRRHQCHAIKESCLITTTVGSIVTSIFALTIGTLTAGSVTIAILIGAVAFFLVSNLINIITVIVEKFCNHRCED